MPEDIKDLAELGLEVEIINLENLTEPETVSAFDLFDVIYVYGGNTFHLMNEANRSGFREHILEIIKNKLYVGVSAGSIIATPNISNAGWEPADPNTCGLVDMRGLNLVPFLVCPHWNGEPRKEAIGSALEIKYLRDGEALAINN